MTFKTRASWSYEKVEMGKGLEKPESKYEEPARSEYSKSLSVDERKKRKEWFIHLKAKHVNTSFVVVAIVTFGFKDMGE